MGNVQVVLFDLGGVVIKSDHALTHALLRATVGDEKVQAFFTVPGYAQFSIGAISEDEFCNELRTALGHNYSNQELREMHDTHIYAVDNDVVGIMSDLFCRDCRLAIATDTNLWQDGRVNVLYDVTTFVPPDQIFRSQELGMLKKDPSAFPKILESLGVPAEAVLLIDDSSEKIASAAAHGMQTHQFTDAAALRQFLEEIGLL